MWYSESFYNKSTSGGQHEQKIYYFGSLTGIRFRSV